MAARRSPELAHLVRVAARAMERDALAAIQTAGFEMVAHAISRCSGCLIGNGWFALCNWLVNRRSHTHQLEGIGIS